MLIVSHETDFLDATVQRIIDLRDGEARSYPGNHSDYRRQRAALLAQQRSTADRQQREIARQTRFIDRFRSTATKAKQVQSRIKALDKIERVTAPNAERAVHFRIQTVGRPERAVLTVQDLSHAYDDHIVLVGANLGDRAGREGRPGRAEWRRQEHAAAGSGGPHRPDRGQHRVGGAGRVRLLRPAPGRSAGPQPHGAGGGRVDRRRPHGRRPAQRPRSLPVSRRGCVQAHRRALGWGAVPRRAGEVPDSGRPTCCYSTSPPTTSTGRPAPG